jgi:tRNA threonylcarbamoyladenosine biosynthesis protein TsaE
MLIMVTRTIHEESELLPVAEEVLASLDLGAGKTALTKALARALHITDSVTSPTFVIMKSYPVSGHPFLTTLTHIDSYRIDSDDEMRVLGFGELLKDPTRLIVIEWPERIEGIVPADRYRISLAITKGNERIVTYGT